MDLPNHELRLDRNLRHISSTAFDSIDKRLRCNLPHPEEWLTYRRQSGIGERCARNVKEPITLALTSELVALLKVATRKQFRQRDGPVFDATNLRREWHKGVVAAGMPNLIIHDLRRSGARNLRASGVPETTIMQIGGWKTRSVFIRYAIVSEGDIADAMQALEQRNGALLRND